MKSERHTKFYYLGWITLAIGVLAIVIHVVNYLDDSKQTFDLTDTTGVCFTLAGLFFVLDNLKLQREAIKNQQTAIEQQNTAIALQRKDVQTNTDELHLANVHFNTQNNVLVSQQYQTTFFSLLNAHSTLVSKLSFSNKYGIEGLDALQKQFESYIRIHHTSFYSRKFDNFGTTKFNPYYLILGDISSIQSYLGDFITLIKLIQDKLEDQDLYYNILFNYLAVGEKYLIGIYCDCYKDEFTKVIMECKFDFTKYYNEQSYKYQLSENTYFPSLSIKMPNIPYNRDLISNFEGKHTFVAYIEVEHDYYNLDLQFNSLKIQRNDNRNNTSTEPKYYFPNQLTLSINENIFTFFLSDVIVQELKTSYKGWFNIEMSFEFIYFETKFTVQTKMYMECSSLDDGNPNSDENVLMFKVDTNVS